jgi:hypothetical protein
MIENLLDPLYAALAKAHIDRKLMLTQQLYDDWQAGKFALPWPGRL